MPQPWRPCLFHRDLLFGGIDDEQQVTLSDGGAFAVLKGLEEPGDPGPDLDILPTPNLAGKLGLNRHVPYLHRLDHHLGRRRSGRRIFATASQSGNDK